MFTGIWRQVMPAWFSIFVMIALCAAAGIALIRKDLRAFRLMIVLLVFQVILFISDTFLLTGLLSAVLNVGMILSIALLFYFYARGDDREFLENAIIEVEPKPTNDGAKADR
jgi:hypothetical protein